MLIADPFLKGKGPLNDDEEEAEEILSWSVAAH